MKNYLFKCLFKLYYLEIYEKKVRDFYFLLSRFKNLLASFDICRLTQSVDVFVKGNIYCIVTWQIYGNKLIVNNISFRMTQVIHIHLDLYAYNSSYMHITVSYMRITLFM